MLLMFVAKSLFKSGSHLFLQTEHY